MRLGDGMIVMALTALGPVMLIEGVLVFAAVEQTGIGRMAETTTAADLRDAGWACGVVSVTGVACWGAEVAAH